MSCGTAILQQHLHGTYFVPDTIPSGIINSIPTATPKPTLLLVLALSACSHTSNGFTVRSVSGVFVYWGVQNVSQRLWPNIASESLRS